MAGVPGPWDGNILVLTWPIVLICDVLLPSWTGNPLREETVYLDSILCDSVNIS